MKLLAKLGATLARGIPGSRAMVLHRNWRDMAQLAESEIAFVSFPKSGRTFIRAMLARLYQTQFGLDERHLLEFRSFREASRDVPRLAFTHDGSAMRRQAEIRVNELAYRGLRVALLARHPGDIAVSRYYHLKHRSLDPVRRQLAQQPLEDFVWTERGGIPSIVAFLNAWARFASRRSGIAIWRYEDFISQPEAALKTLAAFIGLSSCEEEITDAVEVASFEKLKERERTGYYVSGRLQPAAAGGQASFKVRSGGAGGFHTALSEVDAARVDAYVRKHLNPVFDYGLLEPVASNIGHGTPTVEGAVISPTRLA